MTDPAELIRRGRRRTDTYDICTDPDLVHEYEQLLEAREAAAGRDSDSLAGSPTVAIDAQLDALREQMRDATVTLTFAALPRPKFRALVDEHPPRKDEDGNLVRSDVLGVNFESFFNTLIRVSLTGPILDEETVDHLLDELLTDRQWQDLTDVVWALNRAKVAVPFSPAVSPRIQDS